MSSPVGNRLRQMPLQRKLITIMTVVALVPLVLAVVAFSGNQYRVFQETTRAQLTGLAQIIASNSQAAIQFSDADAAAETLAALSAVDHVLDACIYTADNKVFAEYRSGRAVHPLPDQAAAETIVAQAQDTIMAWHRIEVSGEHIGTVLIRYDMIELYDLLQQTVITALLVLIVSGVAAYVLATRLQRVISEPVMDMVDTVKTVSRQQDYEMKVEKQTEDELGMLIDEFNAMLEQIHSRDVELQKINDELEGRVERRTAELNHQVEVRRNAEDSFHNIIDRNVNGILVYDGDSVVRFVNPTICVFLGESQDELIGGSCPEELVVQDGTELPISGPEGNVRFGEIRSAETEWEGEAATMVSVHDITNRRNLQEQLMQSQKMEAVGRLAGGIAHDFNNLLTAIIGYSDLLLDTMERDSQQREDVKIIKKAADRAKGLTRQLLAFSRRQVMQPTNVELCSVVDNMLQMLVRMIPEDIELKVDACNDPCRVFADAGQLEQIVMNLVVNARDAMEGAGYITISVNSTEITEAEAEEQVGAEARMYAVLAVADTGSGIPQDVKEKIFEPFFTTKDVGQGTGLGLSTVYGIVHDSNGFVTVESEIGTGTTFRIYLPLVQGRVEMYDDTSSTKLPMVSKTGGTILLVEDELVVRELVKKVLTRFQYDVLVTESPDEALRVAAEYDGQIDLLLTDVVMPGLSGRQLADRISETRPGMKVLFMSGYTDDTVLKHGVRHEGMAFLHKPFPPEVLIETIEQVLIYGDASGMSSEV